MNWSSLIFNVLGNGVNPRNILYFSFDEVIGQEPEILEEVIENYRKMILKSDEKTYISLMKCSTSKNGRRL